MNFRTSLIHVLRRPATHILFLVLCVSTFSTRWLSDDFDVCGSSPERSFEIEYCLVRQEGKARFQNFDLTDTPTSLLRLFENPFVSDQSNSFTAFPMGMPAIGWTRDTYVVYGTNYGIVQVMQPFFLTADLVYLFLLSVFVVSKWDSLTRKQRIIFSIVLGYLYLPMIVWFIILALIASLMP